MLLEQIRPESSFIPRLVRGYSPVPVLFEMPKEIDDFEFNLTDPKINRRQAINLQHGDLLEDLGDTKLYEHGNKIGLVLDDGSSPSTILYFMQYQNVNHPLIGHRALSQIKVWRDENSAMVGNIATRIFFDYLLPMERVVITDSLQTKLGRAFWLKRVKDAFDRGLNVYYLQLLQGTGGTGRELKKIESAAEFDRLAKAKDFWCSEELHRARKIIISEIEL